MKAERYQITIRGFIDERWSEHFAGMAITAEQDGVTRLCGTLPDQSALHGVLGRIRDLNLAIVSVQLMVCGGFTPDQCRYCQRNKPPRRQNTLAKTPRDH